MEGIILILISEDKILKRSKTMRREKGGREFRGGELAVAVGVEVAREEALVRGRQ